jgi:EAL domain-containing protein (putative c-di-GMP-specific phosphodiesterase class I)
MNYIQHREDAATVIYNAYSVGVHIYIDDVDDPKDM